MANLRTLVKRRKAVRNIRKITRTMELIATARFKKAFDRATEAEAYTRKIAEIAADLRRRDEYDSSRADSPLRPADDAVVVDSTELDQQGVIQRIVELAASAVGAGERA